MNWQTDLYFIVVLFTIIQTGLDKDGLTLQAVQAGAQDYLVKGRANGQILMRALRYAIERKVTEKRPQYQARRDTLTGLPNRALYHDRLLQTLERARRSHISIHDKWETAILLLNLDALRPSMTRLNLRRAICYCRPWQT